jgi:hypothetical protein
MTVNYRPGNFGAPAQRRLSDQLQQSLAPGDGGIRAVDFAAEHQPGFWEAAASSPGMS